MLPLHFVADCPGAIFVGHSLPQEATVTIGVGTHDKQGPLRSGCRE
jgi:hypothetical protein